MSEQSNSQQSNLQHSIPPFPGFSSREETEAFLKQKPELWEIFNQLPDKMRQDFYHFFTGTKGLPVTLDTVFQHVFNPTKNRARLGALLSAMMGRKVRIIDILPREGTQLNEQGSFVIMDALVQLDDNSYANVEMQKLGYQFPLARADCYAADIIMRQYNTAKNRLKKKFKFRDLEKVYCIILMEQSPMEFHKVPNVYRHRRKAVFDTGIYRDNSGLHEDLFICLDSFRSIVHTITKDSSLQEAWLTFLSATDVETILALLQAFPSFAEIYQEITDFMTDPEELMNMLSKELYIMDRNEERMMVTKLQEEVEAAKAEAEAAKGEAKSAKAERDAVMSENRSLIDKNAKLLAWAKEHGYQE